MGTGPSNTVTKQLIIQLQQLGRKQKVPLWHRIAEELSRPTRQRREVNVHAINACIQDGEIALVPGKVLGDGELTKKVKVAAFKFSSAAEAKIKDRLSIQELMQQNPKGKNVRIVG
ncbi:MAG: 50S ribosomal protein L18e [Nanoarchaeota archaeon]|nr:50S ribosomal protein L18e [Nanoarchaeota archaeon]